MAGFLVRHFVKNYENTDEIPVRTSYGVLASTVGIVCNILLFAVKALTGLWIHSVSVMADAFNNLSDAGSSVIGLVGVKLAGKPADKDHPFGHGRIEYIAALVVAFLVLEVGFTFLKDSIGKIQHPEHLRFQTISVIILILSIGIKLWLGLFNKKIGKKIRSKVMLATAADSMGDALTTAVTVVALLFWRITGINIDAFVGIVVSFVIMWAGIGIIRETLEPLIGEAADPDEYERITEFVESYEGIVGTHDLIVHNYGPGRSMASIHAEVPNDVDIGASHEIIDKIEKDAVKKLNLFLVIHMDPIETKDEHVLLVKKQVTDILAALDPRVSIHDFRMTNGTNQMNLIFDMVVPYDYDKERQKEIQTSLMKLLQAADKRYQCVITLERSYVGNAEG